MNTNLKNNEMKQFNKIVILIFTFHISHFAFAQTTRNYQVILRSNSGTHTLWDGDTINIFGFASKLSENPPLPAKTLFANEGDSVVLNAWNVSQGDFHTIHLHGLDVDTRNDGDPMTSFALKHMQDTTYSFRAKHAGTYLYHCHHVDVVHVQMGMYGLIVVKAKNAAKTAWTGGPAYNKEYAWLMSEVDKSWHKTPPKDTTSNPAHQHKVPLPLYRPYYFLVNGKSQQQLKDSTIAVSGRVNDKIYMRLANIGFYDNQIIFPSSLNAKIIDSDGRPLPTAVFSDTVFISPGERYGVMLTPSEEFSGNIKINYINMNTHQTKQTEFVSVAIKGVNGILDFGLKISDFEIYPNPNDGNFTLEISDFGFSISDLKVTNVLGQVLFQTEITTPKSEINFNFSSGIYFVRLTTPTEIVNKKIVVVK